MILSLLKIFSLPSQHNKSIVGAHKAVDVVQFSYCHARSVNKRVGQAAEGAGSAKRAKRIAYAHN
jgi:hypothetical protein